VAGGFAFKDTGWKMDNLKIVAVKAGDEWMLDVLAVPYGGDRDGKDSDGQFFSPKTRLHLDKFEKPIILYYHGYNEDGTPQGDPVIIGEAVSHETKQDGVWWRIALDKANELAKRVWDAAKQGIAKASSGSIAHLVRYDKRTGEIQNWPLVEISLFDAIGKRQPANQYAVAMPAKCDKDISDAINRVEAELEVEAIGEQQRADTMPTETGTNSHGEIKMEKEELLKLLEEREAAKVAEAEKKAAEELAFKARVKAELEESLKSIKEESAKANRLPYKDGEAPVVAKHPELWKFDNLDAADTATMIGVLKSANKPVSAAALNALSFKLESDKSSTGEAGRKAMKSAGIKAGEIDYSTSSGYGDQWVGVAYSNAIWEAIRVGSFVVNKLPQVEFPHGVESMTLPLESTDPVWYNVSENTTNGTTVGAPAPTITSSRLATSNASLTLGKLGARVFYTGELEESSMIPFAAQLRQQLAVSGQEYLESAIIDGDTETTDSTNINNIGGAEVTGGHYLIFDGFRKSCLVTTTANSRAGGALTVDDFLETLKLMGGAGINALDNTKVSFIIDPNVNWKALALPEVLTHDVFSGATIESGKLARIFGYGVDVSGSMHFMSSVRKADSAGKVNTTTAANNLYGAILAVRWDQWKLGWMRHMTLETTRFAASDSTEIVAMMRVGLKQRDTEASAITYGVTV
jgi:hypothetical protein